MYVKVLGPVELHADGHDLVRGCRPAQRAVLALLALRANEVVSRAQLIERLWGDQQPFTADNLVQVHVSRLRTVLRQTQGVAERIETLPSGYRLKVDPDELDLLAFRRLAADGARALTAGDPDKAAEVLGEGLALWRGPALAGVQLSPTGQAGAARLEEDRLAAVEQRIDADLQRGRGEDLVGELRALVTEYPLRERLWAHLMVALCRADRPAEALSAYTEARTLLVAELGMEPAAALQRLHHQILTGSTPDGRDAPAPARVRPPRQLPLDVPGFVGREGDIARLDNLLSDDDTRVLVAVVSGTAGVGKTALATHWSHRAAARFPDGQLYVNLRGFGPDGSAMDPSEALRGFLDALGVPPDGVPAGIDAQAARFRSLLAGRKMLMLLDNARDADQVRPLFPGTGGSLVVVTSRNQLASLAVAEAAHSIALDLLPAAEARVLLTERLGAQRITAEPDAVDEIIYACAHLPLALAIVAARASAHPHFPLRGFADELRHARLDGLTAGADVRNVFSWSYHALSEAAARLFRLLGLHPGTDIAPPAAASLAGVPVAQVRPLLAELSGAHLIREHVPGRYTMHDLLRSYAKELAGQDNTAMLRLLDHYLHTAHAAAFVLQPKRDPIMLDPPLSGVTPEVFANQAQAMAWFAVEQAALLGAVQRAADNGFDTHTWQLAWTITTFLRRQGLWHEWAATQHAALAAARRLGDLAGQARVMRSLGRLLYQQHRYGESLAHLREALELFAASGDDLGHARTCLHLAYLLSTQGQIEAAMRHATQALDTFRAAGQYEDEAHALDSVGSYHAMLGDYQDALDCCEKALAMHQEMEHQPGQADVWDSLGSIHHSLADYRRAIACFQHALDLYREMGSRPAEAETLSRLGDTHRANGDNLAAQQVWRGSIEILDTIGHPNAELVRRKLAG